MRGFLILLLTVLIAPHLPAQTAPHTEAKALDGTTVILPDPRMPVVVIVGFSRASSSQVAMWGKQLIYRSWNGKQATVYEGAMLASVPRAFRSLVTRAIRKDVPDHAQSHFVVLTSDEQEWKKLAGVADDNDAYVLLIDTTGKLRWKTHGSIDETKATELEHQIELSTPK
jgi:hypothetical protein